MTISLSGNVAQRLDGGMSVGSAIELPFFVPRLWAVNGDGRLAAIGGAQFYGGWAVSAEDWQQALEEWKVEETEIAQFQRTQIVSADNKAIDAYTCRSVVVAPICNRTTWFLQDGTRLIEYVQGARQHVQAIACLAMTNPDRSIRPLGPVMLTAKGFQAKNLLDSFSAWDRATKAVRAKIAPGVPAWCFYLSVGTFGSERRPVMVGKAGRQSPITPISAFVPKEITPELIERLFVGQEVAEMMAVYLDASQEWLHAYDSKRAGTGQNGTNSADEFPLDPVPPGGEENPF